MLMRYDALSLRPGRLFGGRRRRRRLYSPTVQHYHETMAGPVRKECVHRRVRPVFEPFTNNVRTEWGVGVAQKTIVLMGCVSEEGVQRIPKFLQTSYVNSPWMDWDDG